MVAALEKEKSSVVLAEVPAILFNDRLTKAANSIQSALMAAPLSSTLEETREETRRRVKKIEQEKKCAKPKLNWAILRHLTH